MFLFYFIYVFGPKVKPKTKNHLLRLREKKQLNLLYFKQM
jgi:hypothetical protein